MEVDKRNIFQVNRTANTVLEVFGDILQKEKLNRKDLQLVIQKIRVYDEVQLKEDIRSSAKCNRLPKKERETTVNFKPDVASSLPDGQLTTIQSFKKRADKAAHINAINHDQAAQIVEI